MVEWQCPGSSISDKDVKVKTIRDLLQMAKALSESTQQAMLPLIAELDAEETGAPVTTERVAQIKL